MMPEEKNISQSDNGLKSLPRPQKIAVFSLSLFAVAIIVFWVVQMNDNLRRPLYGDYKKSDKENLAAANDALDPTKKDTDQDGLNDYEESYVYKTSPYIEDSDSDGLTDRQEVDKGSDPNCPEGQECGAPTTSLASGSGISTASGSISQIANALPPVSLSSTTPEGSEALSLVMAGQGDPATVRRLMIESGADKTLLDQINDEDLMKIYQEALASQSSQ